MLNQYCLLPASLGCQATATIMKLFGIAEGNNESAALFIRHDLIGSAENEAVVTECHLVQEGSVLKRQASTRVDSVSRRWGLDHGVQLNTFKLLTELTGAQPTPWGILKGVRPTKIAHRLFDEGQQAAEIVRAFQDCYNVSPAKAALVTEIARCQRPILSRNNQQKISVYVGIPFCLSRCFYCSFPGMALPQQSAVDDFLVALHADIRDAAQSIVSHGLEIENIYIGGGTPTSLSTADLEQVFIWIEHYLLKSPTTELTVEAGRPDSLNRDKIHLLREHNVTRVSVNPQSMQQKTLKLIGRNHTVQAIIDTFMEFRLATKCLINMDVIAGLPGETLADMVDTLDKIRQLNPDNLTVHTLSVKRGSNLQTQLLSDPLFGLEDLPNSTVVTSMVNKAAEAAALMNMQPYYLYRQKNMVGNLENVGYAQPNTLCRYNIQMMEERQTIIGIGPGATTKAVVNRTHRLKSCYHAKDVACYQKDLDRHLAKRRMLLDRLCAGTLFIE
jgi:oxygen-independent coproporphyrinogen-3 oxidase